MAEHLFDAMNKYGVGGIISWDADNAIYAEIGTAGRKIGAFCSRDWRLVNQWLQSECRMMLLDEVDIHRSGGHGFGNCFAMEYAARKGLPGVIQWTNNFSFRVGASIGWAFSWGVMEKSMLLAIDELSPVWRDSGRLSDRSFRPAGELSQATVLYA